MSVPIGTLAPPVPGTVENVDERPAWFWLMLWCLFVLGVQPWSSRVAAPQGTTGSTNSMAKGLLLGAVFLRVYMTAFEPISDRWAPIIKAAGQFAD